MSFPTGTDVSARRLPLDLVPAAAQVGDDEGGAVKVGDRGTARLTLAVTAVTGVDPELDVDLETSEDGENDWRVAGSFTQATEPGSERLSFGGLDRYVRAAWDIAGEEYSEVTHTHAERASITPSGTPDADYDVVVEIVTTGGLGAGTYRVSLDGGENFGAPATIPADTTDDIGETGITLTFEDETYFAGDTYEFTAEDATPGPAGFGEVTLTEATAPTITPSETPAAEYEVEITITTTGGLDEGEFTYSLNGGEALGPVTIPDSGEYEIPGTGILLTFEDAGDFIEGDTYELTASPLAFTFSLQGEAL